SSLAVGTSGNVGIRSSENKTMGFNSSASNSALAAPYSSYSTSACPPITAAIDSAPVLKGIGDSNASDVKFHKPTNVSSKPAAPVTAILTLLGLARACSTNSSAVLKGLSLDT